MKIHFIYLYIDMKAKVREIEIPNQSDCSLGNTLPPVYTAKRHEVEEGKATVLCTLDDEGIKSYEIEISKIIDPSSQTKNFTVKITDKKLIEKTGGIIQGMSGSPILQNGKLIGAVTHVLVNDSSTGYGIFIDNMLNASRSA